MEISQNAVWGLLTGSEHVGDGTNRMSQAARPEHLPQPWKLGPTINGEGGEEEGDSLKWK